MIRFLSKTFILAIGVMFSGSALAAAEVTRKDLAERAAKLDELIGSVLLSTDRNEAASIDDAAFLRGLPWLRLVGFQRWLRFRNFPRTRRRGNGSDLFRGFIVRKGIRAT